MANAYVKIFVIMYFLWSAIYQKTPMQGYTFEQIMWYLVIAEASVISVSTKISADIEREVQSGEVSYYLTRPISYLWFTFTTKIGECLILWITAMLLGGSVMYFLTGTMALSNPWFLITSVIAVVMNVLVNLFIGMLAIWLEDVKAIRWIYAKIVLFAGGTVLPLEVFPLAIQDILKYLPFAYIAYAPARLSVLFSWPEFFRVLLMQLGYLTLLILVLVWVFSKVVKKNSAQGG